MILVFPGASRHGGASGGAGSFNRLTLEDAEAVSEEATLISGVSATVRTGGQIVGGVGDWNTTVTGVSSEYLEIRAWGIESGEFFGERAVRS